MAYETSSYAKCGAKHNFDITSFWPIVWLYSTNIVESNILHFLEILFMLLREVSLFWIIQQIVCSKFHFNELTELKRIWDIDMNMFFITRLSLNLHNIVRKNDVDWSFNYFQLHYISSFILVPIQLVWLKPKRK